MLLFTKQILGTDLIFVVPCIYSLFTIRYGYPLFMESVSKKRVRLTLY